MRLFVRAGTALVTSLGAYPPFRLHVAGFWRQLPTFAYREATGSGKRLLDTVRRETRRSSICPIPQPDGHLGGRPPTSCPSWGPAETTLFPPRRGLWRDRTGGSLPGFVLSRPNVVRMRTLSKAYGAGGTALRGYAVGLANTIRFFARCGTITRMNRMAQAAGARGTRRPGLSGRLTVRPATAAGRARIAAIAAGPACNRCPRPPISFAIDCGVLRPFALKLMQELLARDVFRAQADWLPVLDRTCALSVGAGARDRPVSRPPLATPWRAARPGS